MNTAIITAMLLVMTAHSPEGSKVVPWAEGWVAKGGVVVPAAEGR